MGCEAAITEEFAELKYEDDDSESSGDDSDDALKQKFAGSTPGRTSTFQTYKATSASSKQAAKKMMRRRKQEEKFEKMKRKIDAKARTTIRNSIDAKAFERSTYDCNTAYELWTALKPTEAYTEEEIHRALGRVRIETCTNDMELVKECMML